MSIEKMPDGVFVTDNRTRRVPGVVRTTPALESGGYARPIATLHYPLRVVTPASIVRTLVAGYPPASMLPHLKALDQST
jgi:hypothetical protein